MELDTNPTKPTKCVRLIEKSDLSVVRLPTFRVCHVSVYYYTAVSYFVDHVTEHTT